MILYEKRSLGNFLHDDVRIYDISYGFLRYRNVVYRIRTADLQNTNLYIMCEMQYFLYWNFVVKYTFNLKKGLWSFVNVILLYYYYCNFIQVRSVSWKLIYLLQPFHRFILYLVLYCFQQLLLKSYYVTKFCPTYQTVPRWLGAVQF